MDSLSNSTNELTTLSHNNKSGSEERVGSGRNESLANVEIAVLSIILVLAVAGNGLMLLALRRQLMFRPMSRMYFFMLNLSLADLLVAFGNILPQLAWDITFRFKGNDLLCRTVKFLQIFVLYLSTYVLTSMAVDRYLVVCHHSFSRNHYGGLKGPKMLVILSWILSFVFASPQAFIFSLKEVPGQPYVYDCWATFIEPWGTRAYVTWFVICAFILPLLIIGCSYGAICYKVISFQIPNDSAEARRLKEERERKKHSVSSSSSRRGEDSETVEEAPLQRMNGERGNLSKQLSRAKIKTLKLTLVVVICFFACWAPFCVTQLVLAYNPPESETSSMAVILLLLAALNSCTNPWIYLAFSESLYNQLRVCLGFGMGRSSDEESIGDEQNFPAHQGKNNVKAEVLERIKPTPVGGEVHSSIERRNDYDDRVHPETKSDVL